MKLVKLSPNSRETARSIVRAFVDSHPEPKKYERAAKALGIKESRLRMWLKGDYGFRNDVTLRVARYFGLPAEAVLQKDAPIGPIVRRLRKLVCNDSEKAAA